MYAKVCVKAQASFARGRRHFSRQPRLVTHFADTREVAHAGGAGLRARVSGPHTQSCLLGTGTMMADDADHDLMSDTSSSGGDDDEVRASTLMVAFMSHAVSPVAGRRALSAVDDCVPTPPRRSAR